MRKSSWVDYAFFVVIFLVFFGGGEAPIAPVPAIEKPTAVVYVYEKDDTAVPVQVRFALNNLNVAGIFATEFEDDTKDGDGETPEQYKLPLFTAQAAGLPSLVVMTGDKVLRVVKDPKTEAAVMEAVK